MFEQAEHAMHTASTVPALATVCQRARMSVLPLWPMSPSLDGLPAKFRLRERANHAINQRLGHFDQRVMRRDRDLAQLPRIEPRLVGNRAHEITGADSGRASGANEEQCHRSCRLGITATFARS